MVSRIVPMAPIGGQQQYTPSQVKGLGDFGQGLMEQGASMAPVAGTGWLQALARGLQGGIGGYSKYVAGERELSEKQRAAGMVNALFQNGATPTLAQITAAEGNDWVSPGQSAMLGELAKSQLTADQEKWAVNPKTGRYYNQRTGEEKAAPPGAPQTAPEREDAIAWQNQYFKQSDMAGFNESSDRYNAMLKAAQGTTPTDDLSLFTHLAKIYDPNSVVREGEVDRIVPQNLSTDLRRMYSYLEGGGTLTAAQKLSIIKQAQDFMAQKQIRIGHVRKSYVDQTGYDPKYFPAAEFLPGEIDPSLVKDSTPFGTGGGKKSGRTGGGGGGGGGGTGAGATGW